jgi:hypothetical protein
MKSYGSILFTDIVGSSTLWAKNPIAMKKSIDSHFQTVLKLSRIYDGLVVKNIGDAFMLFFKGKNSLEKAILFSIELIKKEHLQLRIGICEGPIEIKKYNLQNCLLSDFFGTTVNTASRMESKVAEPGSIAFTIISSDDKHQTDVDKILENISHFHIINYVKSKDINKCKINLKLFLKRSGRMLTGNHILTNCEQIDKLKGVNPVQAYIIPNIKMNP